MPTLLLKFKDKNLRRFWFKKGASVTIGRSEENNIIIENLAVSNNHAKLDSVGDNYILTDLNSKNGTFVNEVPVSSHWLQNGDVITIVKHKLVFTLADDEEQLLNTTDMDQITAKASNRYQTTTSEGKTDQAGILTYLTGGEGDIELNKKLIRVGKNSSSDIVVSGLMVAQTAFTISNRPNGYFLNYVAGIIKPRINGKTVKDLVRLQEFDIIDIGPIKLQFLYKKTDV
jgi:pSer/pThr/pTyr-binding forkhead associated (FHA) protein